MDNESRMNDRDAGYECWLNYGIGSGAQAGANPEWFRNITVIGTDKHLLTAADEIKRFISAESGITPRIASEKTKDASLVLYVCGEAELPQEMAAVHEMGLIGDEGFIIKSIGTNPGSLLLTAKTGTGLLYGAFDLIRRLRLGDSPDGCRIVENPQCRLRILDHWDNMDGRIERGYAGPSIFFKEGRFPEDWSRIADYARLLCSAGINGIVLNNVNVHDIETRLISEEFLPRVAKAADIFREYGIRLFLSINYSSPIELGGLTTADPLDDSVKKWWSDKAGAIYSHIRDFGGFLVKADSEFRPGPFTYGRDHAQGANMLAEVLEPYGGLVIWRCFVYNCRQDWRDTKTDRANAAFDNFMPLDGRFRDNVVLQIKNGPMDFQVREPVSPLIGGLEKTNHIVELQVSQEYTGQQKHLCYLVPQWRTVLDFDTYAKGKGSTVGKITSGSVFPLKYCGMAAVANIGGDVNWTGHDLAQANLYGYGRLAWDPGLSSERITDEWVRMTYGNDKKVVDIISGMLLSSWRTYENYNAPLGIGSMVNPGHHYGPSPDGYEYSAWGTYHRADNRGIGVDRSVGSGTGFAGKYRAPNAEMYEHAETCPEELLLFFHRLPYEFMLGSGKKLIQYIYDTHFEGVEQVSEYIEKWKELKGLVPDESWNRVLSRLETQYRDACEWRDVINSYFYRKTGIGDEKDRKIY